jgi:hypothetical protein
MRRYIVINSIDINLIDFSEVCQVTIDSLIFSNNNEKILLSYEGSDVPSFLSECVGVRSTMSRFQARTMMNSIGWTDKDEEIIE